MKDLKPSIVLHYSKLRGLMAEKTISQHALATEAGMSRVTLSRKLSKGEGFRAEHIYSMCHLLGISLADISVYFFTRRLTKS